MAYPKNQQLIDEAIAELIALKDEKDPVYPNLPDLPRLPKANFGGRSK